jgi:hypothetical protein
MSLIRRTAAPGRRGPVQGPTVLLVLLLGATLVAPPAAYGYLDPASGSVILQILAAGMLAASFTMKTVWRRFTGAVRRVYTRKPE